MLESFDKALPSANLWLDEIGKDIGPDRQRQRCYHALRAVLFALRDRLSVDEASTLAAELVRGLFHDAWRPAGRPERSRARDEFLDQVAGQLPQIRRLGPDAAARAVFELLNRQVPAGEMERIRQLLPQAVRALFPDADPPADGAGRETDAARDTDAAR